MDTINQQPLLVAGRADDHLGINSFNNDIMRCRCNTLSNVSDAIRNPEQLQHAFQAEVIAKHNGQRNRFTHHAKLSEFLRRFGKLQTGHFCQRTDCLLIALTGALVDRTVLVHCVDSTARLTDRYHLLLSQLINHISSIEVVHLLGIKVECDVANLEPTELAGNGSVVTRQTFVRSKHIGVLDFIDQDVVAVAASSHDLVNEPALPVIGLGLTTTDEVLTVEGGDGDGIRSSLTNRDVHALFTHGVFRIVRFPVTALIQSRQREPQSRFLTINGRNLDGVDVGTVSGINNTLYVIVHDHEASLLQVDCTASDITLEYFTDVLLGQTVQRRRHHRLVVNGGTVRNELLRLNLKNLRLNLDEVFHPTAVRCLNITPGISQLHRALVLARGQLSTADIPLAFPHYTFFMGNGFVEVIVRHVDLIDGVLRCSNNLKGCILINLNLVKLRDFRLDGLGAVIDDGHIVGLVTFADCQLSLTFLHRVNFRSVKLIIAIYVLVRTLSGV